MKQPFDVGAVRRQHENRTGIRNGFPSAEELLQLPNIVTLSGLTPAALGYRRFRLVLQSCVQAAVQIAPLRFRHSASYENFERVGYAFRFASKLDAVRFLLRYEAAMAGQFRPVSAAVQP